MNGDVVAVILVFALFAGLVAGALRLGYVTQRRARENLRQLAARLGLVFQPGKGWFGPPRAEGQWRGKPLEIVTYATGSGKSRQVWSAIKVRPAATGGLTFLLQPQGLGTKVLEMFGAREITVGDREFDGAWFVQSNQPDFLRAALIPEVRAKFSAARQAGAKGRFRLEKGVVSYVEPGTFFDRKRGPRYAVLVDVVGDLADIAEVAGR